jgi:hypothetical protein
MIMRYRWWLRQCQSPPYQISKVLIGVGIRVIAFIEVSVCTYYLRASVSSCFFKTPFLFLVLPRYILILFLLYILPPSRGCFRYPGAHFLSFVWKRKKTDTRGHELFSVGTWIQHTCMNWLCQSVTASSCF